MHATGAAMLIGIAGRKQSGKTTLGASLATAYQLAHISFAAPMRRFVADVLDISVGELELVKEKPIDWLDGVTPREMLQKLGTEYGRDLIHDEIWVRKALRKAAMYVGAVISDVRFPNEAQAIRGLGGVVIRLNRSSTTADDNHPSEKPLEDWLIDFEIENNGTPEGMLAKVATCLTDHLRVYREAVDRYKADAATDRDVAAYAAPGCPESQVAGD